MERHTYHLEVHWINGDGAHWLDTVSVDATSADRALAQYMTEPPKRAPEWRMEHVAVREAF